MRSAKTVGICLTAAAIMIGAMGVTGCTNNAANKTNNANGGNVAPYSTYNRGNVTPLGTGTTTPTGTNNMQVSQKAADAVVKIPGVRTANVVMMNRDAYVAVTLDSNVTPKSTAGTHQGGMSTRSMTGKTGMTGVNGTNGTNGTYGTNGTNGTNGMQNFMTYGMKDRPNNTIFGTNGSMTGYNGNYPSTLRSSNVTTPSTNRSMNPMGTFTTRSTTPGAPGAATTPGTTTGITGITGTTPGATTGTTTPGTTTTPGAPTTPATNRDVAVPDNLKLKVSNMVKKAVPQCNNVYVSANPDFVSHINRYAEQFRAGRPISGAVEEFSAVVNRVFPSRTGTTVTPNSYNPSTYRNPTNMNTPVTPSGTNR